MIIKIIPEGDVEKKKIKTVEHRGVKEFFIFGNKKEDDGDLIDFHDWSGGYRYLMGSLSYFNTLIKTEMVSKSRSDTNEISLNPPRTAQNVVPFIKRGSPNENNVQPVVLAEDVNTVIDVKENKENKENEEKQTVKPIIEIERDEREVVAADDDNDQAGDDK